MGHRPNVANRISHVVFVVDESSSMHYLTEKVKTEILGQIDTMVAENTEKDHEIRVTIYTFSGDQYAATHKRQFVHCVLYDMDILRIREVLTMPGMRGWYKPDGMTALIDASMVGIEDLEETAQRHGDHSFLVWVVTDGAENASVTKKETLTSKLRSLPQSWIVGALVPNARGKDYAEGIGFQQENVLVWDAKTEAGLTVASRAMTVATSSVLRSHRSGVRHTTGLFSTGTDALNSDTVQQSGMTPLDPSKYERIYAHQRMRIDELVRDKAKTRYVRGVAYYELVKTETIQDHKNVAVWDRSKKVLYTGKEARDLIGLGGNTVRVKPADNPEFDVFIQSKADNRICPEGTHIVVIPNS